MIIGIGGVSRSGKSTLASQIIRHLTSEGKKVQLFSQDNYYKPQKSVTLVQGIPDWERPNTIKWDALIADVEKSTADVKIIEGLFAFYPASLRAMYSIKFFLTLEKDIFLQRKANDERFEEPDWYAEHVWRSYLKYGQRKGDKAEYVEIDGSGGVNLSEYVSYLN